MLLAKTIMENGDGAFLRGKPTMIKTSRWAKGNKIKLGTVMQRTPTRVDYNQRVFKELLLFFDNNADFVLDFDDYVFNHAGIHPNTGMIPLKRKRFKEYNMYGQVDFSRTSTYRGIN